METLESQSVTVLSGQVELIFEDVFVQCKIKTFNKWVALAIHSCKAGRGSASIRQSAQLSRVSANSKQTRDVSPHCRNGILFSGYVETAVLIVFL